MEGRAHGIELRLGDAHGVEGVNVQNVEAAASIYQHLGEALIADDGVDDSPSRESSDELMTVVASL